MRVWGGQNAFVPKEDVGDKILCGAIIFFLVAVAGLMSGLTLGLLSISKTDVQASPLPPKNAEIESSMIESMSN